jgi:hypothetical protein
MEIELSVLFAVIVVEGYAVGVVLVPQDGQDPPEFGFQELQALGLGELLLLPEHGSKHRSSSLAGQPPTPPTE